MFNFSYLFAVLMTFVLIPQMAFADNFVRLPADVAAPGLAGGATDLSTTNLLQLDQPLLDFGNQTFRVMSDPQTLTLTNNGTNSVDVNNVILSGTPFDFSYDFSNCQTTLNPGDSCTATVSFSPMSLGLLVSQVRVILNNGPTLNVGTVQGTGVQGLAYFNANSVNFPGVAIGVTSDVHILTMTNVGSGTLGIDNIYLMGDSSFTANPLCPDSLAPGESCNIELAVTPVDAQPRVGSVMVFTSGTSTPVSRIQVTSTPQNLTVLDDGTFNAISSLNVASTMAGTVSPTTYFRLLNPGASPVGLNNPAVQVTPPFSVVSSTCSGLLPAGADCRVGVNMQPSQVGSLTGVATISAAGSVLTLPLSGTATGAFAEMSTYALAFARQAVGSSSASQRVTLFNRSLGPITVGVPSVGADYSAVTDCTDTLAMGATCNIDVVYTPSSAGASSSTLVVPTQAGDQVVYLTGFGLLTAASTGTGTLNFGSYPIASSSAPQSVSLNNTGNVALTVLSATTTGPFTATQDCGTMPASIAASSSCNINVVFTPTLRGPSSGVLTVVTSAGTNTVALIGQGQQAALSLSISTFDFGSVQVGSTKVSSVVTVTNTGDASANTLTLKPSAGFRLDNNCPASLAPAATCTFDVVYTAVLGDSSGTVSVSADNTPGVALSLTGHGTAPSAGTSVATVDFGGVSLGQTSATQSVTLTNSGIDIIGISTPTVTGPYSATYNCPTTLAAGQSCVVNLTFSPLVMGAANGQLTIATDAGTKTLSLTGIGLSSVLGVSGSSTAELLFGSVQVGQSSLSPVLTLSNLGNQDVSGIGFNPATGFSLAAGNCSTVLKVGASCQFQLQFSPLDAVSYLGGVDITSSAPTQQVTAKGLGVAASTSVSLSFMDFGGQQVNTSSSGQSVTLTNTGLGPVDVGAATVTGPFTLTSDCPASLASTAACQVSVVFSPVAQGSVSGVLSLPNSSGTKLISLQGVGLQAAAQVSPSSLNLGNVQVGQSHVSGYVTVVNSGNENLTALSIVLPSGYSFASNTCSTTLAASASCAFSLGFAPSAAQDYSGTVSVSSSVGMQQVSVSAIGVAPASTATPASVSFGDQTVGTSATQSVTFTNAGVDAIKVGPFSTTGNFSAAQNCPSSLAAGASCTVNVSFSPTAMGAAFGSLSLGSEAGAKTVLLSGNGLLTQGSVSPSSIAFGTVQTGQTATSNTVLYTNTGNVSISGLKVTAPAGYTVTGSTCSDTLAVGATCQFSLTFSPALAQVYTGTTVLSSNAPSQTISVDGTGASASATLTVTSLSFSDQVVGSASSPKTVTLTNVGVGPVSVSAVSATGPYASTNGCLNVLAPGDSCTVNVVFEPTSMGSSAGLLTLATSAGNKTVNLSGLGLQTSASTGVGVLNFADQAVNTTSAVSSVVLSNTGNTALGISAFSVSGPFNATHNCGVIPSTLAVNASCTVNVTFSPSAMGAATGTLSLTTSSGVETVTLSGTGLLAVASTSVNTVAFPGTPVGQSATAQALALTNSGNTTMSVSAPVLSGPFSATTTCGSALSAGSTCQYLVSFAPSVMGASAGTMTVATSAGTQNVSLTGTGLLAVPTLSTSSLSFTATVGSSAVNQTVTLTNEGNTATSISTASVTGAFSVVSTTCSASLAAGANCTYSVTFTPGVMGAASGTLTIPTGAGAQSVALSGTGMQTSGSLSTSSLAFGNVNVNASSTAQAVALNNTGNTTLSLSALNVTGPFSVSQSCGTLPVSVAVSGSCPVNVVFNPTAMGSASGTLSLVTAAGTQTVSLSGTGLLAMPSMSVSSLNFTATVGSSSTSQLVTLSNNGNTALSLSASSVSGAFSVVSTTCSASLAAGASCAYNVVFNPTAMGVASGTLSLVTAAGTQTVLLSGTGLLAVPSLNVTSLGFTATVGSISSSQAVTLTNNGNTSLSLSATSVSGAFSVSSTTCTTSLSSGGSCVYNITFNPSVMGAASGTLTIPTGAGNQTVSLTGMGMQTSGSESVASLTFGNVNVSTSSTAQTVTLNNTGNTTLSLSAVTVTGPFSASQSCGTLPVTLAVSGSCSVNVTFNPTAMGVASGTLSLVTAAGTQTVSLSGTGLLAVPSLSVSSLGFTATVGSSSVSQLVTLSNNGNAALSLSATSISGAFSVGSTTCSASLGAGANCGYNVIFSPSVMGAASGTLTIPTGAGNQTVSLTGTGMQTSASVSSTSLNFTGTTVGTTSAAQTITLTNTGNTSVTFSGASITGAYTQTNNCASTLSSGASCQVNVYFVPTTMGSSGVTAQTGTLTLSTSAGAKTVSLSGTEQIAWVDGILGTIAMGTVQVGQTATSSAYTLTSDGNASATGFYINVPTGYSLTSSTCPANGGTLAAGTSCSFKLTFSPTAVQGYSTTMSVGWTGPNAGGSSFSLTGTGAAASVVAYSTNNFSYNAPYDSASGHFIGIVNNGYGPVTVNGLSSTSTSGNFTAWMAGSGSGNPNGGYCWPGAVLQPGWSCGAWAQESGAGIGQVSAGTATFSTSAGNVTYSGSFTVQGLSYSATTGATANVTSGQTANLYTLTISNPTQFNFFFPEYTVNGGVSNIGVFTGTNASNFVLTGTTCSGTLAPYSSCTVSIAATNVSSDITYSASFTPNGTFQQVGDGAAGYWSNGNWLINMGTTVANVYAEQSTPVSMTALQTSAYTTLGYIGFGNQNVNSTSSATSVTLSNTGNTPVSISSVTTTGPFSTTHNCPASLAVGANCVANVSFSPVAMGAASGAVTFVTAAGTKVVSLTGTGLQTSASLSNTSLAFSNVQLPSTSTSGTVTLTNTGNVGLTGIAFSVPSGFSLSSNTCGTSLAAGAGCTFAVTFAPTVAQTYNSTLSITSNAPTVSIAMNGTGTNPSLVLDHINPSASGWVMPAYSSSTLGVYYRNNGSGPVTISSMASTGTGAWVYTDASAGSCHPGNVLSPGALCWALPGWGGAAGTVSATLTMVSSAGTINTPISAIQKTLDVSVSNNGLSTAGTAYMVVTITNNTVGNFQFSAPYLDLTSASGPGSWALSTNNCPTTLAANGGSCTMGVSYTAGSSGSASVTASPYGTFEFQDMFDGNSVTGSGRYRGGPVDVAAVGLSASSLYSVATLTANASFGAFWYQSGYGYANATYRNDGNTAMTLTPSASAPFAVNSNGCQSIAPGASCNIQYSLNLLSAGGSYTACPTIGNSTGSISSCATLTAFINSAVPQWNTTSLTFGNVQTGSSSTQSITLYNYGSVAYNWAANNTIANQPAGFTFDLSACSNVAANGGSCSVLVTFAPTAVQSYGGSSIYPSAASYLNNSLSVSGSGVAPASQISGSQFSQTTSHSASLTFPNTTVATSSAAQTVTLYNTGLASMSVGTPTVSGNFSAATNCGSTLAAGSSCIVNVTFSPQSAGSLSGALTIPNDGGTDTVWLYGTGLAANFTFNTTISSNVANYSVSAAAKAAGWNGSVPLIANITVSSGVYVYSNSTGTPAFSAGSGYPVGSTLTLVNYGGIVGAGGAGGQGGYQAVVNSVSTLYNGSPGGAGGTGLDASGASITVNNQGFIAGGGGGGGGGCERTYAGTHPSFFYGGGGGGGAGLGAASTGSYPGAAGTLTAGGAGGTTASAGNGGAGGSLGASGTTGASTSGSGSCNTAPGAGGAPGAATYGNGNIIWAALGTIYGGRN